MKLISFRLRNFKSFDDTGDLGFGTGFSVITGQNNVGKSALLQGLSLQFPNIPHASLQSMPNTDSVPHPESMAEFTLECRGDELRKAILRHSATFSMPRQEGITTQDVRSKFLSLLNGFFSKETIIIKLVRSGNSNLSLADSPTVFTYKTSAEHHIQDIVSSVPHKNDFEYVTSRVGKKDYSIRDDLGVIIGDIFKSNIYLFDAQRICAAECAFGNSSVLGSKAENLAEVLHSLRANPIRYNRFNDFVRTIFPTIHSVQVEAAPDHKLRIMIWSVDPLIERPELAVSLEHSGTGVGQVLAILYVAITSTFTRTIIIDEPNSFLNPGAAKKLIEILRGFPQLQFIISTHSPEILRATRPQKLFLLRWEEGRSTIEQINYQEIESMQSILRALGSSLSDVFGADRILWVEGATEEICFPRIIERILERPLEGTAIVAVQDVGRLVNRKKSTRLIWDIYTKLSTMGSLMPPALAFSFDREGLTEDDIIDFQRMHGDVVHFLPRRMFENYLIDSDAIAAVMSSGIQQPISAKVVQEKIDDVLRENSISASPENLFHSVDGAKLLRRVFSDLSDNVLDYDKGGDGLKLTDWLIANKAHMLEELAGYLHDLLSSCSGQR